MVLILFSKLPFVCVNLFTEVLYLNSWLNMEYIKFFCSQKYSCPSTIKNTPRLCMSIDVFNTELTKKGFRFQLKI